MFCQASMSSFCCHLIERNLSLFHAKLVVRVTRWTFMNNWGVDRWLMELEFIRNISKCSQSTIWQNPLARQFAWEIFIKACFNRHAIRHNFDGHFSGVASDGKYHFETSVRALFNSICPSRDGKYYSWFILKWPINQFSFSCCFSFRSFVQQWQSNARIIYISFA